MEKETHDKMRLILSAVYLVLAAVLLGAMCSFCVPQLRERVYAILAGGETSPIREAFHVLAERLELGEPAAAAFAETWDGLWSECG